jgi:hypothetical protein
MIPARLLYTPPQRGRLFYHVLFHVCLVLGYFVFILALFFKSLDVIYCLVTPFLLLVLGIRWLAWRLARKTTPVLAGKPG